MIFDTIENYARYAGLGSNLFAALKFLRENDLAALPVGRQELDGDKLYLLAQEYTTKPVEAGRWEAHRKYIDIQYMVSGSERMGFANLRTMQLGEYNPEKDFQALTGSGNFVDVFHGSFAIFFPEDAHMPTLAVGAPEQVRKVVMKVKI
jgi:YhcH/YjgK/YiaL family protein